MKRTCTTWLGRDDQAPVKSHHWSPQGGGSVGVEKQREKQVVDISLIPNEARELQGSCVRTAKSEVMLQQLLPKILIERGNTLDSSDFNRL